ncbi:DeoR/GlpR family DNA-binding transcription regulator [Suttonella sp. R2A3]|uniref:DeoR/GlpR family DNA-binding transcription regulator n=1 Tax=Suttonella sp. R2A3 TaxID=2908648 RepID=UPI001F431D39|nr:DeoR/GlpR family DNA-binding transcription regulator [Suttonella sp. R2A3]UJF24061.1 DeoR/GlpR family DNA-binding transcription regulator [Suttonella sp. R2A3]
MSRRELIQRRLLDEGSVSSAALAEEFSVSLMTIYRDLDYLQTLGLAKRKSGGAVLRQRFFTAEQDSEDTPNIQSAKERIGHYAAHHLVDGKEGAIIIGAGTTTLEMARALPDLPINVMANSLAALGALSLHQHTKLYALGGELRKDIMAFGGTMAHANLKTYHFSKAFIGIDGIDADAALTSGNELNARLTELMAEHAEEVYLLADVRKFGQRAFRHVLSLSQINGIITDQEIPKPFLELCEEHHVQVMIADSTNKED